MWILSQTFVHIHSTLVVFSRHLLPLPFVYHSREYAHMVENRTTELIANLTIVTNIRMSLPLCALRFYACLPE